MYIYVDCQYFVNISSVYLLPLLIWNLNLFLITRENINLYCINRDSGT